MQPLIQFYVFLFDVNKILYKLQPMFYDLPYQNSHTTNGYRNPDAEFTICLITSRAGTEKR